MKCQSCGAEARDNDIFCSHCGKKLEHKAQTAGDELRTGFLHNSELKQIAQQREAQQLKDKAAPKKPQPSAQEELEFFCQICGTDVSESATVCPKCGASFQEDDEQSIQTDEKNIPSQSQLSAQEELEFVCQICGTDVSESATVCPKCGASFEEDDEQSIQTDKKNIPSQPRTPAENASEQNTRVWLLSFIGSGIFILFLWVALFLLVKGTFDASWFWSAIIGWGILFIVLIIKAYAEQCPSCHALSSQTETDKEAISRRKGYKTVTRQSETRNSRGEVVATTERQEQIAILKVTYRHYYKCSNCGHRWTGTSTSEYENFTE